METFHYLIGQDTPHIAWWQMSLRAVIIGLCPKVGDGLIRRLVEVA
jgi:hypothetical protein